MTDQPVLIPIPADAGERFQPPVSPAAEPFWEATRTCELVIQWCTDCERAIHFPRAACPTCLGTDLEFRPASGTGVIYALSEMPVPGNGGMAGRAPYLVALVDLPEGVRLLTNVLGPNASDAVVGADVQVAWEPLADGRHLPVFVLL